MLFYAFQAEMGRILKYANKQFRDLRSYLKKYGQDAEPEQLHKVRTELKKIRTLFKLLAFRSKQFDAYAAYKPLKHIFAKAGRIRETDVLRKLFSNYKLKEFEKNTIPKKKEREKEISRFQKNTGKYIKQINQSHQEIKKNLAGIAKYDLEKYSTQTENQLCSRLFQQLREDELHSLRKQIKELVYVAHMLNGEKIPQKTSGYDTLQELIGQWHDKHIVTALLAKSKTSLAVLKKLKAQCAADVEQINAMAEEMYVNRCIKY